jgi:anti-sigma regulatory factor (Ser/Thr protein kinase)
MRASTRPARRTARVEYTLPRQASSARWARQLTTGFLAGARTSPQAAQRVDDANLVVSELVANATRHGRGRCRLRLSTAPRTITVEVRDDGHRRPVSRRPGLDQEGGRGIALVRGLARQFDVICVPGGGKTVRAVLDAA